jgi:uncharacterized delta-60 repeat protein
MLTAVAVVIGLVGVSAAAAALVDPEFGSGGTGEVAIGHEVRSLVKDSSGRFYAVGSTFGRALAITRLTSAGPIDTSYGSGGTLTTFLGRASASPFASAVDSSDRIVVVGFSDNQGYVARFLPSGDLDQAFGTGGVTILPDVSGFTYSSAVSVGVDRLDRVLVLEAGTTPPPAFSETLRVVRLDADGKVDAGYGDAGVAPAAPVDRQKAAIAVDADGRATVSGSVSSSFATVGVVRLGVDGHPDLGWGTNGSASVAIAGVFSVNPFAIDLDPTGRVVIAGSVNRFGQSSAGLVLRLDAAGAPDATFANGGFQFFDDGQYASPFFIAVDATADGIGLAGTTDFFSRLPAWYAGRLNADGSFDQTFGANGRFVSKASSNIAQAVSAADGVVAGTTPGSNGFVTRLKPSTADVTKPMLTLPADITVEATSSSGATVAFAGLGVSDTGDPAPELVCSRTSGSAFPIGTMIVACRATDASGNASQGIFSVIVADRTPPALTVPDDIVLDATAATPVEFTASATDVVDGALQPHCEPASGALFPLGRTDVVCTATDKAGNNASDTFAITLRMIDEQPPVLHLPTGLSTDATSSSGANVTYEASATDAVDGPTDVGCSPLSGALFAIGNTTVTCTTTDRAGNRAQDTFIVHVRGADEQFTTLRQLTTDPRLVRQLERIDVPLTGNRRTCSELGRFAAAARRASPDDLARRADRIATVLGC